MNRIFASLFLCCATFVVGPHAAAETLFAAGGTSGVNGHLLTLDPATGLLLSDIGPLVDNAGNPYGLSGLAFQPGSGVLFGATALTSTTAPHSLVTVDPTTARVTLVGQIFTDFDGTAASDITFTSDGTLYAWSSADHNMFTVNPSNGTPTLVGNSGVGSRHFGGGALAANAADVIFVTPDSRTDPPGTLRTVSRVNGSLTTVGTLTGLTNGHVIDSMAFDSAGTLFGLDNDRQHPISTIHLVTIDPSTGAITTRGLSPNNLDALAFSPVPEPGSLLLAGIGLGAFVYLVHRRKLE